MCIRDRYLARADHHRTPGYCPACHRHRLQQAQPYRCLLYTSEDALFAKKYRNPAKNMDECVTHILNHVQKSGCNGFTNGEIFGQAIHYYEENEIEVGKPMNCQVVVNHVVELTEEEKAEARQNAVRRYQEEELRKLQNRNRPSARKENHPQPSLFDLGL